MGLDISDKMEVSLNDGHNSRLVTDPQKNPKITRINGLQIKCVYRRTKDGDSARDGNPFIYALKRQRGFSLSRREIVRFLPSFYEILDSILKDVSVDYVIPMPSQYGVSKVLARRIARQCGAVCVEGRLKKRTVKSILRGFDLSRVEKKHKKQVKSQLSKLEALPDSAVLSLKKIPTKIRFYFSPVELDMGSGKGLSGTVILVDDLLATGTTLSSAKSALDDRGCKTVFAVCLLSNL